MFLLALLSPLAIISIVSAKNDWTKPCFSGVCEYDLPSSAGSASGILKIWGPKSSIADITPAAGWEIIGCSPDVLQQDIRLVCKEGSDQDCARLYVASGAEGKIVRLPENCGKSAFAVVTKSWVPVDQSIPEDAVSLVRRDGSLPEVKALRLAMDFNSAGGSRKAAEAVHFSIRAANVPGADGNFGTTPKSKRGLTRIVERQFFDFIEEAIETISSLNEFDVNQSTTLPPLNVNQKFNLIDESVSCPPVDARLKIDVDASAHAVATIGVVATGTILPPNIEEFAIVSNMNAELNGSIDILAGVTGTLDSGKILLFEAAIPGFSFPGILTIGPSFQINAQAIATLDLSVGLNVGINYKVDKAELVFPPNSKQAAGGSFNIGDTPLKLSASPGANATGTVEAHLIPSLNLGIFALGGIAEAVVFLELDASATMTLGLQASAEVSGEVPSVAGTLAKRAEPILVRRGQTPPGHYFWNPPKSEGTKIKTAPETTTKTASSSTSATETKTFTVTASECVVAQTVTAHAMSSPSTTAGAQVTDAPLPGAPKPDTNIITETAFGGCFEIGAGLDVNAGANANFFGLFDQETKVSLFSKKFELFKRCFGNNVRRSISDVSARGLRSYSRSGDKTPRLMERAILDLLCPAANAPPAVVIADETVSAAEIK